VDVKGNGVPDARVEIALRGRALAPYAHLFPPPIAKAKANGQGYFEMSIPPVGTVTSLAAEKDGYSPGRISIDLRGETGLVEENVVLLEAVATLRGRVHDTRGVGVANAKLIFESDADPRNQYTSTYEMTTSSESGEYLLAGLASGRGHLAAKVPGHELKSSEVDLDPGENKADIEVLARPTFYIVVKNRRGEPIKYPRAYLPEGRRSPVIGSGDENGLIDVLLLRTVTDFTWEVRADGYRPATVMGNPRGGRTEVTLEDGPRVSGVVVSTAGRPIHKAFVLVACLGSFGEARTITDPAGHFSLNASCLGDAFVEVSSPRFIKRQVRLSTPLPGQDLVIKLEHSEGGVAGRILHQDGRPVTRFFVPIENEFFVFSRLFSDREGRFAILDLPSGQLRMLIKAEDVPPDRRGEIQPETFHLNIRKGMVHTDLDIRLQDKRVSED